MEEIKLKLLVNEVNQVLTALGNLPYDKVNDLIIKIHHQAEQQLGGQNDDSTEV
jgi:hypothetical protein